jgi:hypothetical protein
VNDINTQYNALTDGNVPHGELVEIPEIIKMVEVNDPDGNKVVFVQDTSKGI